MKQLFSGKILWLASYPKSGNTWFRAFLTALMNDGRVDINALKSDGLFSLRDTFDLYTDISSHDLYDDEAKLMVADVYRYIASKKDSLSIIKVHDSFGPDPEGRNLIPEDATHSAIYFIRNPLDIAGSLANHMSLGINEAVDMLNNSNAYISQQSNNFNKNNQFRQHISDWSSHVNSWTLNPSFPVCVIRYEDMLTDTFDTFNNILNFIGLQFTADQVVNAIKATNFDSLSKQETEKGFNEAGKSSKFFRAGTMGNWESELSTNQVNKIILLNRKIMEKYRYI